LTTSPLSGRIALVENDLAKADWVSGTSSSSSPTPTGPTLLVEWTIQPVAPAGPDYNTPRAIAARARASVAALGDDPAAVAAAARRAQDLVADTGADAELAAPFGPRRLVDCLPIRVAELVIAGLDLTRAVRSDVAPPPNALRVTLHLVAEMVDKRGAGADVVLALAGRTPLPQGFSVY